MLVEAHTARQMTKMVVTEAREALKRNEETFDRRICQIRGEIQSAHQREGDTQADLIGMLKLKLTEVCGVITNVW